MFWKNGRKRSAAALGAGRRWSLAARLAVWYVLSAAALLTVCIAVVYWALEKGLDQEDDRFLAQNVRVLQQLLRSQPGNIDTVKEEVAWEFAFREYAEVYVRVLDGAGRLLVETPGMSEEMPARLFPPAVSATAEPRGRDALSLRRRSFRVMAAQVGPDESGGAVIQLAFNNSNEESLLRKYRRRLVSILLTALLACAVVGYRIAQQGIRPVLEISEASQRIRPTTLHERIDTAGLPAELYTLADTFNHMLNRLEESFTRVSQFSADIAHELRTPINNLRGEAEVALSKPRAPEEYREVLTSCLEESLRLSRTIDSLFFLARADQPQTEIACERVDVGDELSAVREFYEAMASEVGVALNIDCQLGVRADLDRTLFQRAVGNLIANAIAHTPKGGHVTLSARGSNAAVHVEVADTGCGIAAEHLPRVFDRFYRVEGAANARRGLGLGLAIVKSISTLHRGSVQIASEVGRGTRVVLIFPKRAGSPA